MAGQIPERVQQKRRELAMAAQHEVAVQVASGFVGQTLRVLTESHATAEQLKQARVQSWEHGFLRDSHAESTGLKGAYTVARSQADAPDIDGRVYIRGKVTPGEFREARIIGHTDYDLIAEA